ncbi:MAG: pantoate--beta-alanine ligase [Gammaproteobacteria bacterium]
MHILDSVEQARKVLPPLSKLGRSLALVCTMGNLHEGHLSLVRAARERGDDVIVSIFVNPMQFAEHEDFDTYPRAFENDVAALQAEGVGYVFAPENDVMYPMGLARATRVDVPELSGILCGASRPQFFRGVATVVNMLFNAICPDLALFGEKDYQELVILRRMVRDLHMPVDVIAVPTVREPDGLAMSTRNRYLSDAQRRRASAVFRSLQAAAKQLRSGSRDFRAIGLEGMARLEQAGFRPDYFSVRRAGDLASPSPHDRAFRVFAAGWLGETRLIDNVGVDL